uniref:deoxyribonuclease II n=1 Tax=Paramormyrops kingsleyae TaxID=1676925 RepID=A0A3B3QJJ4_9TELE|nr:deoxyribonuclease-2-beta [Paramormyrops kingsleyae]
MWLILVCVFLSAAGCVAEFSCRNEAGDPVDWFIIYKIPKYKNGTAGSGLDYMYLDSSVKTWQYSNFLVNDSLGALGNTFRQLYQGQQYKTNRSAYMLYNDAPPFLKYDNHYGHTKGALLFDTVQGFWMIHSVPHFPPPPEHGYSWPSSGKMYGQTAFCVTYKYHQLPLIAEQLLYYNPRVYNCSLPAIFQPDLSSLALLCKGSQLPRTPDRKLQTLMSAKGETLLSFAKSHFWVDDIYTGWVAQALKTDLLTETWQRKEHQLPSNCSLPEHTLNIKRIKLPGPIVFSSFFDHSKWCVSRAYEKQWTCLGDLNREDTQAWKSGGLICSQNPDIYHAFRHTVSWYISC